jgi:hypothetical protein
MNILDVMHIGDVEEVKEETFKIKAQYSPFDFVNSINKSKTNLINDSDNPDVTEKEYNPWIVNKSLSYFADTVQFANMVNSIHSVDKKLQYDFLINIVRPKNRYSKWVKKEDSGDIDIVKEVYGYSSKKAEIALSLLSTEQIAALKRITNKGGLKK